MADPRIIAITLDEQSFIRRAPDVEEEKRVAVQDLLGANHFRPVRTPADGYEGPYRVTLHVDEGRLGIDLAREDGSAIETFVLSLAKFRRPVKDYFAICDSHAKAIRQSTAEQIETVDMARRSIHNEAAQLLKDRLDGKIEVDFPTARRLFTLLCILHIKA